MKENGLYLPSGEFRQVETIGAQGDLLGYHGSGREKLESMRLGKKIEYTVFWPDSHVPYQDKQAVKTALSFVKDLQPQRLVILGDLIDFLPVSRFRTDSDPRDQKNIQQELDEAGKLLDQIRDASGEKCETIYIPGNHEARLNKYLWKEAANLVHLKKDDQDVLSIPYLLDLKARGIQFIPFGQTYLLHNWNIEHGDRASKWSAYTAKAMVDTRRVNTLIGHTHRLGTYFYSSMDGVTQGVEAGCLIDKSSPAANYAGGKPNWQTGLAVGEYDYRTDNFQVTTIPFKNNHFIFNGKVY